MDMEKLVALCRRRGFIFQSSEIYGGINGFWDYGPLGVELKRNVKEAWWRDMVTAHDDLATPEGAPGPYEMVGLDCAIIMHPQVWKCSGHYDLFHDFKIECKESKKRYRFDQVQGRWLRKPVDQKPTDQAEGAFLESDPTQHAIFIATEARGEDALAETEQHALKYLGLRAKDKHKLGWVIETLRPLTMHDDFSRVLGPDAKEVGTLTQPREFNLMFKTIVGALGGEEDTAFLRPETAQGIFVNFKNVLDSTRVGVPFGIAQMGKSFRNEITPKQFTFRSREFEQMEIEFFCHPKESPAWYRYWRDRRYQWYIGLGLAHDRLRLRDHDPKELSHYSCGTADIEYAFPFLPPGEFGELEGVAHRGDFDLRSHMEGKLVHQDPNDLTSPLVVELGADGKPKHKGSGKDLSYFDEVTREKFVPHVIEPSAGADRATLAFLCEAYAEDEIGGEKRVVMRFHPRLAPVKAAVFPLVNKEGMPEKAQALYRELKKEFNVFYDEKGAVGRRYRRQDEAGTPFCITIDGQTLQDDTVTIRERDSTKQKRVPLKEVADRLRKLEALQKELQE